MITKAGLYQDFLKIHDVHPLIHQITNTVTINDCANATLAVGASPVMADSPEEAAEMAAQASALVINIGTLNEGTLVAMKEAGRSANRHHVPVILDPVGAGATSYRKQTVFALLDTFHPDIICGNMSEINVLAGRESSARGVDSGDPMEHAGAVAEHLAGKRHCVVAITGEIDAVSDGTRTVRLHNGVSWLASVTGTGCMTNSLIAAFAGTIDDRFAAAVGGIIVMGLSGQKAEERLRESEGIGSFRIRLFDAFSTLNEEDFAKGVIDDASPAD
ncbi:hydroxyethylthiazole kinase [Sporolactobacillus vineae]|uniref:hydroxyethylthiazole kinase n=1 Tax=Sporolactobacillus vineae TaxID=444463 RepID=UPI00028A1677|nr:hydroxyethylthiazole kinase [Sporolactobacillus vineae]